MKTIRLAAIGLRIHGEYAVDQFLQDEAVEIVAIAEVEQRWRAVAERHQVPFYEDYLRMLDEMEFDTAIVCLPNDQKADAIVECLKRGINVICDKPMAITENGLHRIEQQAAVSQGEFCTLLTERFNPLYMKAKELVDSGKIGQVAGCMLMRPHEASIHTTEPWMFDQEKNGGIIVDLMIHDIDLARWICRADVVEVTARSIRTKFFADKMNFVDCAQALFVLEGGIVVNIQTDWLTPANTPWDCRMFIVGSDGTIEVLTKSGEVIYCTHNENHHVVSTGTVATDGVCQDFIRRIRGQQHVLTAEDCISSARAVLLARQSSESGTTVTSWR